MMRVVREAWIPLAAASYDRAASCASPSATTGADSRSAPITGAVDGVGPVAVVAAALGQPLHTRARGIGDRPARSGFIRSSLARLGEALVDPPPRFGGRGEDSSVEDLSDGSHKTRARVFGDRGHAPAPPRSSSERRGHRLAARGSLNNRCHPRGSARLRTSRWTK